MARIQNPDCRPVKFRRKLLILLAVWSLAMTAIALHIASLSGGPQIRCEHVDFFFYTQVKVVFYEDGYLHVMVFRETNNSTDGLKNGTYNKVYIEPAEWTWWGPTTKPFLGISAVLTNGAGLATKDFAISMVYFTTVSLLVALWLTGKYLAVLKTTVSVIFEFNDK